MPGTRRKGHITKKDLKGARKRGMVDKATVDKVFSTSICVICAQKFNGMHGQPRNVGCGCCGLAAIELDEEDKKAMASGTLHWEPHLVPDDGHRTPANAKLNRDIGPGIRVAFLGKSPQITGVIQRLDKRNHLRASVKIDSTGEIIILNTTDSVERIQHIKVQHCETCDHSSRNVTSDGQRRQLPEVLRIRNEMIRKAKESAAAHAAESE